MQTFAGANTRSDVAPATPCRSKNGKRKKQKADCEIKPPPTHKKITVSKRKITDYKIKQFDADRPC